MNNYHDSTHAKGVRLLQTTAIVAAGFAGVGMALGIHESHGGWGLPIVTGTVLAGTFAATWHVLIGFGARVRHTAAVAAVGAIGAVVTGITLGASAQAIATAMSGQPSVAAVLTKQVDSYNQALGAAYAEATSFAPLVEAANINEAGYRAMAQQETTHGGCGPRCEEMNSYATSFQGASAGLQALLDDAAGA